MNRSFPLGALVLFFGLGLVCLAFWLFLGVGATSESLRHVVPQGNPGGSGDDPVVDLVCPAAQDTSSQARQATPETEQLGSEDAATQAGVVAGTTRHLRGRVVDTQACGLVGVEVAFLGENSVRVIAISGREGRFELDAPSRSGQLVATDPELENLVVVRPMASMDSELLLVVARHRFLGGVVVDEEDNPVPKARVLFSLPAGFRSRFEAVFDSVDARRWECETDAEGRFQLERAPLVGGASVEARLDGYVPASVEAPPFQDSGLFIVLQLPEADDNTLSGRVIDRAGTPQSGALVTLGEGCATTASDGTFRLKREDVEDARQIVAIRKGRLPGRFAAPIDRETGEVRWPKWVELVIGEAPLELSGRVVDGAAAPRAGIRVWLDDPTEFGHLDDDLWVQAEFLIAPEGSTYEKASDDYFRYVITDKQGRFRLQGLLEREYTLGLCDSETLDKVPVFARATPRGNPSEIGGQDRIIPWGTDKRPLICQCYRRTHGVTLGNAWIG